MLSVLNLRRNSITHISGLDHNFSIAHLFLGHNNIGIRREARPPMDVGDSRFGLQPPCDGAEPAAALLKLRAETPHSRRQPHRKEAGEKLPNGRFGNLCSSLVAIDNERPLVLEGGRTCPPSMQISQPLLPRVSANAISISKSVP